MKKNIFNLFEYLILYIILMKKLFIILLFLISSIVVHSQSSIGFGYGYTSSGDSPGILSVQIKKIGGYISYVNDAEPITTYTSGTQWHEDITFGATYEVFSDYPKVNILTGVGWNSTIYWYDDPNHYPSSLCSYTTKGFSYEAGFDIQIYKYISLVGVMNNYSGMKTMIKFKYTFLH